ncbi:metal-dependent hydrolase [Novosphingobium terrae]|uniref:metal-dependent hydrolase n=1 Tax=Novosphingobium terrae TaxID=2726189 RepID=UPI00237B0C58|nr:metal-dependent hydrolase [Novosphingobium terrae]
MTTATHRFFARVKTGLTADKGGFASPYAINVRNHRFLRNSEIKRWWLGNNPVATAWHNALSATFPRGEAFFIDSLKVFREGASPELAIEIRNFIAQEAHHSREHLHFNRHIEASGFDLSAIDARLALFIAKTRVKSDLVNLIVTAVLEHLTTIIAREVLGETPVYRDADAQVLALWRWHAVEEIEHKAVAYDTFLHATRRWSAWRRWRVRCIIAILVTRTFVAHRWRDTLELLAQDGITGWRARGSLLAYLVLKPGVLRRILPDWLSFLKPGYHPAKRDDSRLLAAYEAGAALQGEHPALAGAETEAPASVD